jgi:hypothetical protein
MPELAILLGVIFGLAVGFPAGRLWALRPKKPAGEDRDAGLRRYQQMKQDRG